MECSFGWMVLTSILSFAYYWIITGMMSYAYRGWKIKGNKMILGLPVGFVILYGFITLLFLAILLNTNSNGTNSKIIPIILGWSIGLLCPLIAWFSFIKYWTSGYSRKEALIELREFGDDDDILENKIDHYKALGLIREG